MRGLAGFIIYVLIEIALFAQFGSILGTFWVISLVLAGFIIGVYLIRLSGANARASLNELTTGSTHAKGINQSIALIVSGLLIILPGFMTDIFGLIVLFPPTRKLISNVFAKNIQTTAQFHSNPDHSSKSSEIIEGEVIDKSTDA